jgi:hypothetical protein
MRKKPIPAMATKLKCTWKLPSPSTTFFPFDPQTLTLPAPAARLFCFRRLRRAYPSPRCKNLGCIIRKRRRRGRRGGGKPNSLVFLATRRMFLWRARSAKDPCTASSSWAPLPKFECATSARESMTKGTCHQVMAKNENSRSIVF